MEYTVIEKDKGYCIYKHTNKLNQKVYIGQTKQSVTYRWGSNGNGYVGCPKFWNAIQKYGWNNFEHEILEDHLTLEEANEKEKYWIQYYDSINNGYNITAGGEGRTEWTDEQRQQQSQMVKQLWENEEYREYHSQKAKDLWENQEYRKRQEKVRGTAEFKENLSKKCKDFWDTHPEEREKSVKRSKQLWDDPAYRKKICKKVICSETQQIFDSVKDAAKYAGVKPNTMSTALRSITHKSGKHPETGKPLHWYYYEEVSENAE